MSANTESNVQPTDTAPQPEKKKLTWRQRQCGALWKRVNQNSPDITNKIFFTGMFNVPGGQKIPIVIYTNKDKIGNRDPNKDVSRHPDFLIYLEHDFAETVAFLQNFTEPSTSNVIPEDSIGKSIRKTRKSKSLKTEQTTSGTDDFPTDPPQTLAVDSNADNSSQS